MHPVLRTDGQNCTRLALPNLLQSFSEGQDETPEILHIRYIIFYDEIGDLATRIAKPEAPESIRKTSARLESSARAGPFSSAPG